MERDSFKCLSCGSENKLTVHHLYYKHGCKPWEYPDKSLVKLCETCHNELHDKHAELAGNLAFEMLVGFKLEEVIELNNLKYEQQPAIQFNPKPICNEIEKITKG